MFLVCGEALIDFFPSQPLAAGTLGFTAMAAGSPFNVAVGLARLGRPVSFFTKLSADAFGRFIAQRLDAEKVDHGLVRIAADRPTTLSFVATGPDGSPEYVFLGEGAADRSLTVDDLPASLDPGIRALHFGSFSLAVEPSGSAFEALALREGGRRAVAVDANVRPRLTEDFAALRGRFERLAACATVFKASSEDVVHLYGTDDFRVVAERWQALGTPLVLVTDGSNGAHALGRDGWSQVPTPAVQVVDTVGAGDTFQAAVLAALDMRDLLDRAAVAGLGAGQVTEVVAYATAAAAITCGRRGADLPRLEELPVPG